MPALSSSEKRTVEPAQSPVTLAEQKEYSRIISSDEDETLYGMIKAATAQVERDTRRALINQTWEHKLDEFPGNLTHIELSHPPLSSVTSIQYVDSAGSTQTWDSSNYEVDINREPGVIYLGYDKSFPETRLIQNAITITAVHGYSADPQDVPWQARQAIKMLADEWYQCRSIGVMSNRDAYLSLIYSLRWGSYV